MGTAYSKLRKALPIPFRQQTGCNPPIQCTDRGEDDQRLHNRAELGKMTLTGRQLHSSRDEQDGGWCGWMSEKGYPIAQPTDEVRRNNWPYIT